MTRKINYTIALVCDIVLVVVLLAAFFGTMPAATAVNWALIACIPGAIRGLTQGLMS